MNPYFERLIETFNKLAGEARVEELTKRVIDTVALGGKAIIDQGLRQFPKTAITDAAADLYDLLAGQEIADSLSSKIHSIDEAKVKEVVDNLVLRMQDRDTALSVARQVQDILNRITPDELEQQLEGLMSSRSINERLMFLAIFGQVKPLLEQMRTATEETVADQLTDIANNLPRDLIAAQVAQLSRQVTPEHITRQTQQLVGKLPAPEALADMVHTIGDAASRHFTLVSKSASAADALAVAKQFAEKLNVIITDTFTQDKKDQKKEPPKGGDFSL